MEDIVRSIFGGAGIARDAVAALLASAGLDPAAADIAATALLTLAMAALYFGVAGTVALFYRRRAAEAEASERAGAPVPDPDGPWSAIFPQGHDADAAAWLLPRIRYDRIFEATMLRLSRENAVRIESAPPEEGGARVVFVGRPREGDRVGAAALGLLALNARHGADARRAVTVFAAMPDGDWSLDDEGNAIELFMRSPQACCEQDGLSEPADARIADVFEYRSIAFVLAGLAGAVWFSSAVPAIASILIFILSSVVLAGTQTSIRERGLTPSGARVAARMDALKRRVERCLAETRRLGDGAVSAAEIMEYAVVLGFSDDELASLAAASGSAELERLFRDRRGEDALPSGDKRAAMRLRELREHAGMGANLSLASRLRAVAHAAVAWYDYETAPSD